MEKTIRIGEKEVRLCNNAAWVFCYREQFGHDIVPTLMPLMSSLLDFAKGIIEALDVSKLKETESGKVEVSAEEILRIADTDAIMDMLIHMSGLELTELFNITWALAKTADEDLPEPRKWIREFESFPVDDVAPEIFNMIVSGMVSSKKLKRLKELMGRIQPLISTPSPSEQSNEDSQSET